MASAGPFAIICISHQTTPAPRRSAFFYRPDAIPDAQPTAIIYTVSQKTSHLWLAISLRTRFDCNNFWHKCTFPPHLTSASALPWETENPEIASFHLNAACFFTKKTRNTVKNIAWSELKHPSLSKWSTWCTRQDLGREHSILLPTHMLCVSQVCHGVSHCVKDGSCSLSSLE